MAPGNQLQTDLCMPYGRNNGAQNLLDLPQQRLSCRITKELPHKMAQDAGQFLLALFAGIGAFTVLHVLGFGLLYKTSYAGLALVGGFFAYKLFKGESLDGAAGELKRNANKTYRDAKGAVNDAYNEARAKAR
ncbi:g10206 [Coccomyxa elongata]